MKLLSNSAAFFVGVVKKERKERKLFCNGECSVLKSIANECNNSLKIQQQNSFEYEVKIKSRSRSSNTKLKAAKSNVMHI